MIAAVERLFLLRGRIFTEMASAERESITEVWGRASALSGVQGQSPWLRGQGAKVLRPLKLKAF